MSFDDDPMSTYNNWPCPECGGVVIVNDDKNYECQSCDFVKPPLEETEK